MCPWGKEHQWLPVLYQESISGSSKGWSFLSTPGGDTSGVLCPVLGSLIWDTWTYFSRSSKWLWSLLRNGSVSLMRWDWESWCSSAWRRPQGRSYQCVCSHTEIQKVSFKCNYFTVRLVVYLAQVTQRGFGVSVIEEDDYSLTRPEPE